MDFQFLYTIDPAVDEPIMLIDRHIGFDNQEGFGIDGDYFAKELLMLDGMGKSRIQIWINSPGGIVSDGFSIFNAILKTQTKVDTYCCFMAASISAVIFLAGRSRIMADYSWLMYHNPFIEDDKGNKTKQNDPGLATMRQAIITAISARCGMSEDDVSKMMDRTSFILAPEALELGLCTEIDASENYNKKREVKALRPSKDIKACYKSSQKVFNSIFQDKKFNNMAFTSSAIANRLNLNPEASETAVLGAIDALNKKKDDAEKKCDDLEKKMNDHKEKMDDLEDDHKEKMKKMQEKYDDLKKEYDDLKKKADDDDDKAKEDKAKNLIQICVTQGRIKSDTATIDMWTAKAKGDFDGTKALLESLTINRKAVNIDVSPAAVNNGGPKSVVAKTMIEASAKFGF